MEKNERLAWRTKPRTHIAGAFPAAQSAIAMGDSSNWQISKNNFSEPEKLFFDFPLQTPLRAGNELFRCFSSCPKRNCNGRPFQLANFKKQLFIAWNVVFWFSPPHTLRAGNELFRCFSSCPKRNCNGRPFQRASFKNQLFIAWNVVFWFSPPHTLRAGNELFRCFSSYPKAWKVVFWFSPLDTLESRQWAFQVLFELPKDQLQW